MNDQLSSLDSMESDRKQILCALLRKQYYSGYLLKNRFNDVHTVVKLLGLDDDDIFKRQSKNQYHSNDRLTPRMAMKEIIV